jgi:RHS repeat-associated protein
LFSAASGRLITVTKAPANTWTTVKVQGVAGIPQSGVAAVQVAFVTYNADDAGSLYAAKTGATPNTSIATALYPKDAATTTSIVPVGDDGSIQVSTSTSTSYAVDVQGYYSSGTPAAGGFNAIDSNRLSTVPGDTVYGAGQSVTFGLGGSVPSNAGAVVLNILAFPQDTTSGGWLSANTPGVSGGAQLNWPAGDNYNWTTIVKTPSSAGGKAQIQIGPRGKVKLAVSVIGYYAAASTTWKNGTFVPGQATVLDTKANGGGIAGGGAVKTIQVAGVNGVPPVGSGIQYVAASIRLYPKAGGHEQTYASDSAPELTSAAFNANEPISAFTMVPLGPDGAIKIQNSSGGVLDVGVDIQGWFSSLPEGPRAGNDYEGARTSATNLPFPITDQTSTQVDVGTGNMQLNIGALSLPGVTSSVPIGASYNSRGWRTAVGSLPTANRWNWAFNAAGDLSANGSGVEWTDGTGATWQFRPGTGAGAYTSPAGLQMTLTLTNSGYTLKSWTSNQTINFDLGGNATSVVDRNSNKVTINRNGANVTSIVSNAGPSAARTLNAKYEGGTFNLTQGSGSATRSVSFVKDGSGNITSYTDATGQKTTFAYSGSDLTTITAPTGGVTAFTYDSTDRVTKVEQRNTSAGSPGTAVTRFSYASDTSTQVAGPRSDQSKSVADAAHTTYTLDGNDLVTKAVDPAGREQGRTYNAANNGVATSTSGTGTGASKTTNSYGQNSGQSLTKSQSSSGASSSATYGSASATAYLPETSTDSSSNTTKYGYSGVGNQLSSTTGNSANAATAKVEYNSNGTVKTATAPGNDGNPTKYAYDANNQLGVITPPTGTKLGEKNLTYDGFGRLRTETDGRGNTTTFTYDNDDRLLTTSFSDGTTTVTKAYDGNGNLTNEASASGTVTNVYDQENHLTSTANTAGGGTVTYGYDLAGNISKVADGQGTVQHDYDQANVLTSTTYPTSSGTAKQLYTNDDKGRRTDTWLNAVANSDATKDPTSWQARQHVDYDSSGKVTRVRGWTNSASQQAVVDVTYCYLDGVKPGADCSSTNTAADRDKIQWAKDNLTGQTTDYGYTNPDGSSSNRLTGITQAGGSDPTNWAYTYDAAGNRTEAKATKAGDGSLISDQKLTYNAVGQITSTGYDYDGTGNLIAAAGQTFSYNGAQQMTASVTDGVKTSYTYAGADMNKLLSQITEGGPKYDYTYGTNDRQGVPVITSRTIAGTGTASIITDPSTGQPLNLRTTDGVTSMLVLDGIGNPVAALADTGQTAYTAKFDAYGAETVTAGETSTQWAQNPYGFKGGLRSTNSNSGLTKFGYRWQSAATGQWIQRDTLDAPLAPSNANRYAFAGDDPINNSDPTGLISRAGKTANELLHYGISSLIGGAITATCAVGVIALTGPLGLLGGGVCGVVGAASAAVLTQDFEGPFD